LTGGFVSPPTIFAVNRTILVFRAKDRGDIPITNSRIFRMDVFKAYRYVKSFDVRLEGYPASVDFAGRPYTRGIPPNPFIYVYALRPLID
jgi:hypothetical protein